MKLTYFSIANFRGLVRIDATLDKPVSVIVGPNAIGKTSILEAIRLTKGLLAPRFGAESNAMLNDMGATNQDRLMYDALAGDVEQKLEINLTLELNAEEIAEVGRQAARMVVMHMRNLLGLSHNLPEYTMAQYMSSEQGRQAQKKATAEVHNAIAKLVQGPKIKLALTIDSGGAAVMGGDLFSQEFISVLDAALPPVSTLFSYFPADRALPAGEANVQIGSGDAQAKLNSHLAQPMTKYTRLKSIIVHEMLLSDDSAKMLREEFTAIFDGLLIGKRLKEITITKRGTLAVQVEETQSGKTYDMDRMSSGEKGLILQFLLMRHSLADNAIVLIDEPELHLNPAVCKRLLPFFVEQVIKPHGIQAIVCSHSADILATAFEREDCQLFHLRSGKDLSPIYRADKTEVFEALKRLGAGTSEVLFSRGTLFLEGVHDADLLEVGFPKRVGSFKLTQLRGRSEIEKEIKNLQEEEKNGHLTEASFFLFDRDRAPTALVSSDLVKIKQWQRYCFENYLLDVDMIYDVIQENGASRPPESRGSFKSEVKEGALGQLKGVVTRAVYDTLEPENCGIRGGEVDTLQTFTEIADTLEKRINNLKANLESHAAESWKTAFVVQCETMEMDLRLKWEQDWHIECDGKRMLQWLHRRFGVKGSLIEFKKRIAVRISREGRETWRAADSLLNDLVDASADRPR